MTQPRKRIQFRVVTCSVVNGVRARRVAEVFYTPSRAMQRFHEQTSWPLNREVSLHSREPNAAHGTIDCQLAYWQNPHHDDLMQAVYGKDWRGFMVGSLSTKSVLRTPDVKRLTFWADQGMTADEIARMLEATDTEDKKEDDR